MTRKKCVKVLLLLMLLIISTETVLAASQEVDATTLDSERSLMEVSVGFVRFSELQGRSVITASSNTTPDLIWAEIMLQKLTGTDPTNEAHWTNQWMNPEYRYDSSGVGTMIVTDYFDVIIGGTYRTKVTFYENNGGIITTIGPVYSQPAAL